MLNFIKIQKLIGGFFFLHKALEVVAFEKLSPLYHQSKTSE